MLTDYRIEQTDRRGSREARFIIIGGVLGALIVCKVLSSTFCQDCSKNAQLACAQSGGVKTVSCWSGCGIVGSCDFTCNEPPEQ